MLRAWPSATSSGPSWSRAPCARAARERRSASVRHLHLVRWGAVPTAARWARGTQAPGGARAARRGAVVEQAAADGSRASGPQGLRHAAVVRQQRHQGLVPGR